MGQRSFFCMLSVDVGRLTFAGAVAVGEEGLGLAVGTDNRDETSVVIYQIVAVLDEVVLGGVQSKCGGVYEGGAYGHTGIGRRILVIQESEGSAGPFGA